MGDSNIGTVSSSTNPAPPRGILKKPPQPAGALQNHSLLQVASEIDTAPSTLQKSGAEKKFQWEGQTCDEQGNTEMLRDARRGQLSKTERSFNATPLSVAPTKWLNHAREITQWARNRATAAEEEVKNAEAAQAYLEKKTTATAKECEQQLKEWISVAKDRATQANKYFQWAQVRVNLMEGNTQQKANLHESGRRISSAWTTKQLNEDFELAQKEPWAQLPNARFDEIRIEILNLLASKERFDYTLSALGLSSTSQSSPQTPPQGAATESERSIFTQPVSNYPSSHDADDDHDHTFYDIAPSYARHPRNEDGTFNTYITLDMHGTVMRDDTPKAPSDSCIIS